MKNINIVSSKKYLEEALSTSSQFKDYKITTNSTSRDADLNIIDHKDRVCFNGFEATKPLSLAKLIAAIEDSFTNHNFNIGDLSFDIKARKLSLSGREEILTETETKILQALCEAAGNVVPSDVLLFEVLGYDARAETNTIETHIYRIRQKLKNLIDEEIIITSGNGYVVVG